MNGLTISDEAHGGVGGGGTERARADTYNLFDFLWRNHNDTICPVIGGRGADSLADFTAGKQLTLPDMRGRAPFGIDGMGRVMPAGSSGRIADAFIDTVLPAGKSDVVGVAGGDDDIALTTAQIPAHSHPATGHATPLKAANHGHPARYNNVDGTSGSVTNAGSFRVSDAPRANFIAYTGTPDDTLGHQIGGSGEVAITGNTGNNTGGGGAHENMPPFMLFMFLIKL
jgi:microcystin-dependent protein